ncbi:alpha/beta hydrolase [Actinoplanes sp. NPDC026619]|uniref:alpha/beta hydrolase n=1 Tax=Actinoplanes sp. NPDC026619 TaxID=3155798 RepID=UPI0034119DF5
MLLYGVSPAQAQVPTTGKIVWAACPEDAKVQCGEMNVPADWSNPAGPTVMLTVARRPALDPAHRIGVLMINPGGPGGSAVDFTFDATTFFGEQVRKQFDIVGMDPRGVGRSSPVLCSQDLIDAKPSPLVETPQQYAALIDYNRRLAADCASRSGPVFPHVDTGSVVRDMDAVRAALGEEKISFYGASYGSLMGEEYAERYPTRLRALALDGVMDHTPNVGTFLVQETDAAQDAFREFVAWCARDTKCILHGRDVDQIWAGLMARARAGTLQNPYDLPEKLDPAGLAHAAFSAFYEPQWYSFAYYLKDAAGLKINGLKINGLKINGLKIQARSAPPADIKDHSFPAVICSDWYLPITGFPDLHRRLSILAARAPQMLGSPLALAATAGCLGWPNPPANPQHQLVPPAGLPPILLVGTRHDPATAYVWAQRMAQQFGPVASLLTYEGWGHVVYNRSKCVAAATDRYLISLTRPVAGASCPPVEPQPFGVG